jgi:hypothetical protein
MAFAATAEITTVENPRAVKDRNMTSRAKNTPASGALKIAAMPAAAPAATKVDLRRSDILNERASVEPNAEPI